MPIYKATEQRNPTDIFVGAQPLQRVYAGDKLVWQKVSAPGITPVKYGLLYNWWAATDVRGITSEGWKVPSYNTSSSDRDILIMQIYLGYAVSGGKLKEVGIEHWNDPNVGATNETGMTARGSGFRRETGLFDGLGVTWNIWNTTLSGVLGGFYRCYAANISDNGGYGNKAYGYSIRPFRLATTAEQLLSDGTPCANYVQNNGIEIPTVKIGTQVWTASNLCETRFRNGDWIPGFDGGVYTPITNATWAALTTPALCAYNDDLTNVLIAA